MLDITIIDPTKYLLSSHIILGESNGNPLQYFHLENAMDGGAWWAAVHGVAKSWTQLSDFTLTFPFMHWKRKRQSTPVFLPGESQEQGSLVGCHLWGPTELDITEVIQQQHHAQKTIPQLSVILKYIKDQFMVSPKPDSNRTSVRSGWSDFSVATQECTFKKSFLKPLGQHLPCG